MSLEGGVTWEQRRLAAVWRGRLRGMLYGNFVEFSLITYLKDGSFGAFQLLSVVMQPMGPFLPQLGHSSHLPQAGGRCSS